MNYPAAEQRSIKMKNLSAYWRIELGFLFAGFHRCQVLRTLTGL